MARASWRRRTAIALGVVVALVVTGSGAVHLLLRRLERPFLKRRLQSLLHRSAGVELEYQAARADLASGAHLTDLRIATPPGLRAFAPDLVRIGTVDARWTLGHLLGGGRRLDELVVRDVEITIVLDADGRSSFDLTPPGAGPPSPGPPAPRSRAIADLLATALPLRTGSVGPIRVTVLRTAAGQVKERISIEGVSLAVIADGDHTRLRLGTRPGPLEVRLHREGTANGDAALRLWLELDAAARQVGLQLEAQLVEQSIDPQLASLVGGPLLGLDARVDVDPAAGRVGARVTRLDVAQGALTLDAELELLDDPGQPPRLLRADGKLDGRRALQLAPALGAVSIKLDGGELALHARELALGALPRVEPGGELHAAGELRGLHVGAAGLQLDARSLKLDLRSGADRRIDGFVGAALDATWRGGPAHAEVRQAGLAVTLRGVELDPARLAGQATIVLELERAGVGAGPRTIEIEDVRLALHGGLAARPPYGATVSARAGRVRLLQGKRRLLDDPLRLELKLGGIQPVLDRPLRSAGTAHLELGLGPVSAVLDATKASDALDYTVTVDSSSLAALQAMDPLPAMHVAWSRLGLHLGSKGRLERLAGSPTMRHETSLALAHVQARAAGGAILAGEITLALATHGDVRQHAGQLTLSFKGLQRDAASLGDGQIAAQLALDAERPAATVELTSSGSATPALNGKITLGFARPARTLSFAADLALRRLEPLAPVLAPVAALRALSLRGLELDLAAHGALTGVVDAVERDGTVRLGRDPLLRAAGEADVKLRARRLAWHSQDRAVEAPELAWQATLRAGPERRALHAELDVRELHVAIGATRLDLAGLTDGLDAALLGDPRQVELELDHRVKLRALRQELAPAYPTGELSYALKARVSPDGVVHVPELRLENRAAGTSLTLKGGLDLGEHRRSLSMQGDFRQDLARAWTQRQDYVGRGTLSTEVRVESGDLRRYRTTSAVRIKDGYIELPRQKIRLEQIDGEVPVMLDATITSGSRKLSREIQVNSYSELRFIDQHPMMSRRSYLSLARVETPWATMAPLAGNLVIDNNIISMSQLELGARGGRITGRAVVAMQGRDTRAELNVRASNVRSSRGEPFDGNAALSVSVRQRSVQGRAEILRIGRRHLLDLLDVVDPPRADAAINRVRRALALGYPEQVRLSFTRGFAAARITMGGLARLVRIDEIRGIPMGPIIDRVLDPFFAREEE